jgi:hypothetical protein
MQSNNDKEPRKTPYYSVRTGRNPQAARIDLPRMLKLFKTLYDRFENEGYFQEALGYFCVDAGYVPGTIGQDLEGAILLTLHKDNLTPIHSKLESYTEADLFDIIEFLYDNCSKPMSGRNHDYMNCGMHYSVFNANRGRAEFLPKVNELLAIYSTGFRLTEDREIQHLPESGLDTLIEAPVPVHDPENVEKRIESAKRKFLRRQSSDDDRRDAVRELADVLEFLRPKLTKVLDRKDENDLFNIANNFSIRHHSATQKTAYDKAVWYPWMFYFYLATIHAVLKLIGAKSPPATPGPPSPAKDADRW